MNNNYINLKDEINNIYSEYMNKSYNYYKSNPRTIDIITNIYLKQINISIDDIFNSLSFEEEKFISSFLTIRNLGQLNFRYF